MVNKAVNFGATWCVAFRIELPMQPQRLSRRTSNAPTPASVDSIPTSANQEDHVSMAAHGARRLLPMVENAVAVVAIELLAAAQGCDFHAPLTSSPALERVRAVVRKDVPHLDDDRHFYPDLQRAITLVRDGTIAASAAVPLPAISS